VSCNFLTTSFISQLHHGLAVYSTINRNEYQKIFLGQSAATHKADNLTAICEPTVQTVSDLQHLAPL
jgi:hypothetical protein